jgi:hypothetical protein
MRPIVAIEPAPHRRDSKSMVSFPSGCAEGPWQSLECRRAGTADNAIYLALRRNLLWGVHLLEPSMPIVRPLLHVGKAGGLRAA